MNFLRRIFARSDELNCRQVGRVIQSYLDNELDDSSIGQVAAHLDACARCGLETEVYEALQASLHRVPIGFAPEPVARLREFGERLARGELDPEAFA